MATTTLSPAFAPSAARPSHIPRWIRAFVNAVAASRARQAAAELRRRGAVAPERTLIFGDSRPIRLDPADCLPFTL